MNYLQYLQGGGTVSPVQALIESVINSLGQDQEALQKLVELAEAGDEEALAFIQELLKTQTPQAKCGSKLRKKAELGTKLKVSRNGCKCATILKKQGGLLIEVNSCTGLPVHQSGGGIKKYQTPANTITMKGGLLYMGDKMLSRSFDKNQFLNFVKNSAYDDGMYYFRDPNSGKIYIQEGNGLLNRVSSGGWSEMKPNADGVYDVLPPQVSIDLGYQKPLAPATESTTVTKTTHPGLFTGDPRSLAARKEWVKNNADFLKSEYNWDANRIANYKGDAIDNLQLKKAIAAKLEKDVAWAAKKPEGYDEMLTAIRPTTAAPTPAQVVVPAKLPFRKNGGKFNYSDYLK